MMKIKDIISELEKFPPDLRIFIKVPGDNVGYWEIERNSQFQLDESNSKEKILVITIY